MSLKWTPKKVRSDWNGGYGDIYGRAPYGPESYVIEKAEETPIDVKAAGEQATESARGFGRGVLAGLPRMLLQLPMKAAEGYVQLAYLLAGAGDAALDLERYSPADMVGRGITEAATSILPHGQAWDPSRKDLVDAAVGGEVLGEAASPFVYQGAAKGIVKAAAALPKGSRTGAIAPEMLGLRSVPPKQPVVGSSSIKIEVPPKQPVVGSSSAKVEVPPKSVDSEAVVAYRARLAEDAARKAVSDSAARAAATRYANATDRVAAAQLKAMQDADAAAAAAAHAEKATELTTAFRQDAAAQAAATRYLNSADKALAAQAEASQSALQQANAAAHAEKAAELTKAFGRYPAYRHALNVDAQAEALSRQMLVDQLAERGTIQAQAAAMQEADAAAAAGQHAARATEIAEAFSPEGIQTARTARRLAESGARRAQVAAAAERELTGASRGATLEAARQAKTAAAMRQADAAADAAAHASRAAEVREAFTRGAVAADIRSQIDTAAARAAGRRLDSAIRAADFAEDPIGQLSVRLPEAPEFLQRARSTLWENMFPGQSISATGLPDVPGTGSALLHFARSAARPALTAYGASVVAKGGAMLYGGWADTQAAYVDQAMADAQDKAFRDFVTAKGGVTPENAAELARDLAHVWTPERQASIELAAKRAMAKDLFGPRLDIAVPTKKPVWIDSAPRSGGSSPRETGTSAPAQSTGQSQSQVPVEAMTPAQRLEKVWAEAPDVYEAGVRRWMAEQASDRVNAILLEDQKVGRVRTRKFQEKLAKRDVTDPATSRMLFGTDDITDFETVAGFGIPDEYFTGGQ